MAVSAEFITFLEDIFSPIPNTSIRKMFGGVGVFRHNLMFALALDDGKIALKADEETIPKFEYAGSSPWIYHNKKSGKKVSMGYWYAPEFILDEPDEFKQWAIMAFDAAARIDAKKPPSQQKLK